MTAPQTCYLGVDVGLTATKAAAFDAEGRELAVVHARTPRTSVSAHRHDVDMTGLADTVLGLLAEITGKLAADGWAPAGVGVAAHGNGLYPVDAALRPVGPAIASSDSRAQHIVAAIPPQDARRLARETGSIRGPPSRPSCCAGCATPSRRPTPPPAGPCRARTGSPPSSPGSRAPTTATPARSGWSPWTPASTRRRRWSWSGCPPTTWSGSRRCGAPTRWSPG